MRSSPSRNSVNSTIGVNIQYSKQDNLIWNSTSDIIKSTLSVHLFRGRLSTDTLLFKRINYFVYYISYIFSYNAWPHWHKSDMLIQQQITSKVCQYFDTIYIYGIARDPYQHWYQLLLIPIWHSKNYIL